MDVFISYTRVYFLKYFIYLFLERGEGREKERERNIDHLIASCIPPTGDLACNPGMCPDWDLNLWPFGLWDNTQPTELYQSGQQVFLTYRTPVNLFLSLIPSFIKFCFVLFFDKMDCGHSEIYWHPLSQKSLRHTDFQRQLGMLDVQPAPTSWFVSMWDEKQLRFCVQWWKHSERDHINLPHDKNFLPFSRQWSTVRFSFLL